MTRFRNLTAALTITMGLTAAGAPALAHHSFAMFDFTRTMTLKGVVKEFQWTNPHVVLWFETAAEAGAAPVVWSVELTSPGNLTRAGWTKRALKPGDPVLVEFNPLRDGEHGGGLRKVTLTETGQVLTSQGPAQGRTP